MPTAPHTDALELGAAWKLHPQVVVRPESFGALAYHFGTRRLSFLKSPALRDVVTSLEDHPTARDACSAVGIPPEELGTCARALGVLAATDMLVAREPA